MSDVGEVRTSNMELIDQLTKAKAAIEKLTEIKEKQRAQIDVSWTLWWKIYRLFQELKTELKLCSHAATDDRDTLQTQLKSLTSDLQVSKLALDETIKREKTVRSGNMCPAKLTLFS